MQLLPIRDEPRSQRRAKGKLGARGNGAPMKSIETEAIIELLNKEIAHWAKANSESRGRIEDLKFVIGEREKDIIAAQKRIKELSGE